MTAPPPSITCPRCIMTSYHPKDIEQGYCGHCHAFTSPGGGKLRTADRHALEHVILHHWAALAVTPDGICNIHISAYTPAGVTLYVAPDRTINTASIRLLDENGREYTRHVIATNPGGEAASTDGKPVGNPLAEWLWDQVDEDERDLKESRDWGNWLIPPTSLVLRLRRVRLECATRREIIRLCAELLYEHEGGPDVAAAAVLRSFGLLYKQNGRAGFRKEWLQ